MVCNEQLVLGRVLAECDMWVEEEVEEEEGEEEEEEEEEEGREEQHDNCDTRPVQSAELHFQKFRKQQELAKIRSEMPWIFTYQAFV